MSIVFMDNFGAYGTNKNFLLDGVYASIGGTAGGVGTDGVTLVVDPDGSGDIVFRLDQDSYGGASNKSHIRYALPAGATATVGIASRTWLAALPQTGNNVPGPHQFNDVSNNPLVSITIGTTGIISARSGDYNGTVLGDSGGPVVTADGWYHIETKVHISATVGTIEVRVEGITVINLTGLNLGVANIAQLMVFSKPTGSSTSVAMYLKDFIVWNTSGAHNTDFIGTCSVVDITPDSDVSLNWTPTGSTHGWDILNRSPPVDASDYITAGSPPPAAYAGTLTSLPPDITSVKGLMTQVRAAKTDGGDATLQVGLISGVSTDLGADRVITVAQTYWMDISEEDPATAAPWTVAAVNAANIQINRTT